MSQRKPTIAAVDDEADVLQLIHAILEPHGYVVVSTGEGKEAHNLVAEKDPDILLLDIKMPGKSGMEVLGGVKSRHPDVAVIMVTGVGDTQTAVQTMRMGASDYLVKPFTMDQLLISVERALDKRMMALQLRDYQVNLENKVADKTRELHQKVTELTALNQLFQMHMKQRERVQQSHRDAAAGIYKMTAEIQALATRTLDLNDLPEGVRSTFAEISALAGRVLSAARETLQEEPPQPPGFPIAD